MKPSTAPAMPRTAPVVPLTGYLVGALGAALFATKGIVIKLALVQNVDAVTTLTWRMLVAVPIFVVVGWLGYRGLRARAPDARIAPRSVLRAALVGILGYYLASLLDFLSLEHISAQFNRLILLIHPVFVVLFGAMLLGRKVSLSMWGALALCYLGLMAIFVHDLTIEGDSVILGAALALATAVVFAAYQLLAKPSIDELGARLFTSVGMTAAGLAVVVHFLITHPLSDLVVSGEAMWLMLAMGTFATVIPAYLISAAIGLIGAERTAVVGYVSPLVTIVLAVSILGEAFSLWHAVGAVLVLLGVFTFSRVHSQRAAPLPAPEAP